jgi:glycosyltransferase involved in cell wall biosynthesis
MSSQRTILIVTPYFEGGGLERYALTIGRQMQQNGWRVVMVAADSKRGHDSKSVEAGITTYRLSYQVKLSNTVFSFAWAGKLRRIIAAEQPDIINAHAPVPGLADIAARVAGRIPFVLTYHTGTMKKGRLVFDLLISAYEQLILPSTIRRSRILICSSDFIRDGFLRRWKNRSVTITPGVDEQLFRPASKPYSGPANLLFVANYGPSYRHKGLADAIRSLAILAPKFPELTLTICGHGDDHRYQELARELDVADRLRFVGWNEGNQLTRLYQQASLVVQPSSIESFGMSLAEALSCGVPVVSTTAGGISTLIENEHTGLLVPPHNVKALAAAIQRLLSNPGLARQMGEAGRVKVETDLAWQHKTAATQDVFAAAIRPHIAQVTAYYPPHLGGVENTVEQLSATLAAKGYTVDVLTSGVHDSKAAISPAPTGVSVRRFGRREFLHTPLVPGLFRALLKLPRNSVIHLHISQALVPELTWLAAKLRGLPVISHVHLDVDPSGAVGRIIFRPYKRVFLRFVLRHSDRVIFLTADQQVALSRKYNIDLKRTLVCSNGVAADYFLEPRTDFHTPLRLLYVGRLAVQKRAERAVQAMASLPNAQLSIVGDGEDRPALEAYAREHDIRNVTFHGAQRGPALRRYYAQSDILLMTSDREGMPLVLLEAMASGLPIVGSDVVGIRELISGVGHLVKEPSAAAFTAALTQLSQDPAELARLSAASRRAASAYSWDHLANSLSALYSEVAS